MYRPDFGLTEEPFDPGWNPRFFHLDASGAVEGVLQALADARPIVVVVGADGSGKTSLLRYLAEPAHLGPGLRAFEGAGVVACKPSFTLEDIMRSGGRANWRAGEGEAPLDTVEVLLLDDADRLPATTLSDLLRFRAATARERGPLSLVMSSARLPDALSARAGGETFPDVPFTVPLCAMSFDETDAFIRHRLAAAGHDGALLFSSESIERVFRLADGNAGRTVALCRKALSIARREYAVPILPIMVEDAAERLWGEPAATPEDCVVPNLEEPARTEEAPPAEAPSIKPPPVEPSPVEARPDTVERRPSASPFTLKLPPKWRPDVRDFRLPDITLSRRAFAVLIAALVLGALTWLIFGGETRAPEPGAVGDAIRDDIDRLRRLLAD